jgi:hypothetical protein
MMKVITIRQPFASLIIAGFKRYETRSWQTSYHGPLLIHASTAKPLGAFFGANLGTLVENLLACSLDDLPCGRIVGAVDLVNCFRCTEFTPDPMEEAIGYWRANYYAWMLANPIPRRSVRIRGQLGIWTICPESSAS